MFFMASARKLVAIGAICGLSLLADQLGAFSYWNDKIGDLRMALSPKVASGGIVFVAIDSTSLSDIGTWPWSRKVHAALLDALVAQGAGDILFDIDFTFPSDPEGDRAFADALNRVGGGTYLAVFEQSAKASDAESNHINLPLPAFANYSWPAAANVFSDRRGLVGTYPFGIELNGEYYPSAAAALANRLAPEIESFEIDYSIRPDSIPVISAMDVLNGTAPSSAISGRAIIIGASAVELTDQLAVPVHGVISGPLVHALAAETLLGDALIREMRAGWVAAAMAVALLLQQLSVRRSPVLFLVGSPILLFIVEFAGLFLFRTGNIMVPSAMLYPGLIGFGSWLLVQSLQSSNWLLLKASVDARNTLRLLERVFDDGSDGVVILDNTGSVLRHSASAAAMLGETDKGVLNLPKRFVDLERTDAGLPSTSELSKRHIEVRRNGSTKILEYHATHSFVENAHRLGQAPSMHKVTTLVLRDITLLKEQESDIAYLSNYDARTGALRRNAFLAFLGLRLENREQAIVFAVSFDRLKTINVTLGRAVGDAILKEAVNRIERSSLRLSAPVRLGGANFAFYTESRVDPEDVAQTVASILDELGRVYQLEDATAQVAVRLGYTCTQPGVAQLPEVALEQAEEALANAKETGTFIAQYDRATWEGQKRAREIERAMKSALENGEFQLLYQPQNRVSDGALVGAEALIRWHSPTLGQVFPDEFIGIAESTGFIVALGRWILNQAATDAYSLPSEITIAVNVSGIQIMRSDLVADVTAALSKVGLPPNRICLEMTETVFLDQTDSIIETMQDLRFLGVSWALDDFGTGFSSMEYLSKMPLEKVKLDKTFTMNLGEDPTARPILHSTSELCRGLGVKLLCEGVETETQLSILAEEGCAEAQGYYFGKPMPIERLLEMATGGSTKETR